MQAYIDKIGAELEDTMTMCGAANLKEITRDMSGEHKEYHKKNDRL